MDDVRQDWDLLREYLGSGSQEAFRVLVERHIGLVYAAARRRVGNVELAEDVTQAVFMILAAKAGTIRRGTPLPPWLYNVTRYTCANAMKMEKRRQRHECKAAAQRPTMVEDTQSAAEENQVLLPMLDAAIDWLGARDRGAVLLRYFEGFSFEQVGASLGSSAHAAEVRVSRAVEKLRRFFVAKGAVAPVGMVTATLAARAADAAPPAVAGAVTTAALGKSALGEAATLASVTSKSMSGFSAMGVWAAAAILLLVLTTGGAAFFMQFGGVSNSPIPASPISNNLPATQQSPATRPVPANLDVAALVRKVREDESWIDRAQSFHITLEDKWIKPPEGIELHRAELKKQFPLMAINETTFPELKPETDGTLELAFDQRRLLKLSQSNGFRPEDFRFWDGQKAVIHERYSSGQENYAFDKEPERFIVRAFLIDIPWPEADFHPFWWHPRQVGPGEAISFGLPEDYRLTSREDFRAHDCYVLEAYAPRLSLYIGVADQRLYQIVEHVLSRSQIGSGAAQRLETQLAADFGRPGITTARQYDKWLAALSPERQAEVEREFDKRLWPLCAPFVTQWYENYAEVVPGCWMPMHMGYDIWNRDNPSFITASRQQKVVSVTVDQPLADDLFTMPMKEGVQVNDWGHDPPLFYKFKKHTTATEWDKVLAEARQRKQDELARESAENVALGKPAPAFGQSQWLNSKPLAWSDLKGKVVILDFFAEWCGPCQNDLPRAVEIHKNRQDTGVLIIGIHPPGSEMGKIQKIMRAFQITYPVYIDLSPPKDADAWGLMYSQFGVRAIPDTFLIDVSGNVVAHGPLAEMSVKASELAANANASK
ncbi:MAG: sigma-70 family RNA polymerase sigma factor [Tepidisphaeraceae bacterium]|jgi:RNA polymerase sigma factor (sigma-70 family)